MQSFTHSSASFVRLRAWLLAIIILWVASYAAPAFAAAIYSGQVSNASPYSNTLGLKAGVENSANAADAALDNYATLYTGLGIGAQQSLRLKLSSTGQVGDRVGMLVAAGGTFLNVSVVSSYIIRTYLNNGTTSQFREALPVSASVVDKVFGGGRPTQLEFVAGLTFNEVELVVSNTVALAYSLNIYYAYSVPSLIKPQAKGALSKFAATGTGLQPYYGAGTSNVGAVSACVLAGVDNPDRAVDNDLTNYAQFLSTVTVGCPQALSVRLAVNQPVPAGYYAGFVIENSGLLDLSLLSGLKISTYLNGVATGESATGANLLELRALPNGKSQVSFPTTMPFNEVKIERVGAVSVLDNLRIYYGFGVEPAAFQATTHVRSDFTTPPTTSYEVSGSSLACVTFGGGCTVINPANAADNNLTNYASINTAVALAGTNQLKLDLNGPIPANNGGNIGLPGNRAGMVVNMGGGLLDAAVLDRMTLTTYDVNGRQLESASGSALLGLNLLSSNMQEVSFLTTQPFAKVQLSISNGVALGSDLNIYYAFSDDRTSGLPSIIIPLPVELTAFTGRWANGGAELNWATATEKNSSHFVVERSTGSEAGFVAVGQVAAAGNSTSPKKYQLLDAEAGTQGVAVLYYRLRQVDLDGKEAYSPLVSVQVGKLGAAAPQLQVYPNPTADTRAVQVRFLNVPTTGGLVQTYSQMGQLVSQQTVAEAASQLTLPTLAPGLYHMVLRADNGQQLATQRLVVEGR